MAWIVVDGELDDFTSNQISLSSHTKSHPPGQFRILSQTPSPQHTSHAKRKLLHQEPTLPKLIYSIS
jgi:hypothetical protein